MINLTNEDYEQILLAVGSDRQSPFKSVQDFLNWIASVGLDGQQFTAIEEYLNKKYGTAEKIYNKKEGRSANANALQRLSDWLCDGTVISGEIESESKSESTSAYEEINVNYGSLHDIVKQNSVKLISAPEEDSIDCTGNNIHYVGKCIIVEDEIGLVGFDENKFTTNLIALLNNNGVIVATGYLKKCNDDYRIITLPETTDLTSWGNNSSFKVVLFSKKSDNYFKEDKFEEMFEDSKIISEIRSVAIKISEKKRTLSSSPLCIDFGTSNTTAGYFTDDKDDTKRFVCVKFVNTLEKEYTLSEIYPTIVYVKHCDASEPSKNIYIFGFDAKKQLIEHDYMPDASVFFEIKRWFGIDPEKQIHISDEEGNEADLTYSTIIKAYLMHIIEKAEDNAKVKFDRIHFTAPVKLKAKFMNQFEKLFKDEDFKVNVLDESLDEGISVIYETIRNNLRFVDSENRKNFDSTNLMIIDCGGGTTDVASCSITRSTSHENNNGIEELSITTDYVGGEANFGGNNITYRIMQLIKIKLAFYYAKEMSFQLGNNFSVILKEILPSPEDILNFIDENHNSQRVYKRLQDEYDIAEKLIPTKFEEDNELTKYAKKKKKIKRNFYYLWNLAESIKIEFYKKDQLTLIGFTKLSDSTMGENYENILDESKLNFSIFIRDGKELVEKNNLPQITITAQDVDDLIRGDIYALLCRIFYNDENTKFSFYRFSGQSCKIRLFGELMKEFIPGKRLRDVTKAISSDTSDHSSEKLKTSCIKGTVYYEYDTKHGNIQPVLNCENAKLGFYVSTEFNGKDVKVLDPKMVKLFAIPDGTEHIPLNIRDRFGELINRCTISLNEEKFEKSSEKISNGLSKQTPDFYSEMIVEQLSNAESGRYCFIYPGKNGFELYVVTIRVDKNDESTSFFISNPQPITVENSSQTFFDGNK